ncbi:unnamed protein product [Ranitomeya imitator]|uniref:non-specific serine/threonine protein kinase n=1 Tax=Ranitomeya imitator TaxID=111125 RepID=A0ABN9LY25_9NEOB|nr:unnamed protein product [Ranitomeya imitator]
MSGTSAGSVHELPLVDVTGAAASEFPSSACYIGLSCLLEVLGRRGSTSVPLLITSAGYIKVTDFGLSKVGIMIPKSNIYKELAEDITREFMDHEMCGTPYYFTPEIILKEGYGRPVDWWSMGIILYEFLVGVVPFDGDSLTELYESVTNGGIIWDCDFAPPLDAQNLITELLRKNPADRLGTGGAFEIKGHPFLCYDRHDIEEHLVSEDEEWGTNEDNKSFEFQNFTSSSERLSKLCTITPRTMNEGPPPQCSPASSKNISETQKESFCAPERDDPISSLPFSSSLSEIPGEEEVKSAINLSIKEEYSENVKKGKKETRFHLLLDLIGLLAYLHVVTVALVSSKGRFLGISSLVKDENPTSPDLASSPGIPEFPKSSPHLDLDGE